MEIKGVRPADLSKIVAILSNLNLPSEDCKPHLPNFFIVEENSRVIAVGGLEVCGKSGLVRSIAIIPECQGRELGK